MSLNQYSGKSSAEIDQLEGAAWADWFRGQLKGGGVSRLEKFPNYMSMELTLSATDTFTSEQVVTPISRLSRGGKKVTIMELLWVDFSYLNLPTNLSAGRVYQAGMSVGSAPLGTVTYSNPNALWWDHNQRYGTFVVEGGTTATVSNGRYSFQSADGHGLLMATDTFNLWGDSTILTPAVISIRLRLFYRFVDVGITEYIGIVQSQQQN